MPSIRFIARKTAGWFRARFHPRNVWEVVRYYVGGLYDRLDKHHVFLNASGLAFSLFVCIMPMVLIIFAILGEVLTRPSIMQQITRVVDRAIPYSEYADFVKEVVIERVGEFAEYKREAGAIGLVGLLFAATGLFSGMRTVLNTIFRIQTGESILLAKLRDLVLVIIVLVFVLLSTTVLPSIEVIIGLAGRIPVIGQIPDWINMGLPIDLASLIIIFVAFLFLYYSVPQARPPRAVAVLAALSAALLWFIAKEAFGVYLSKVVTLKRVYGAYSLLIVVAFWIYYTAIVFIIGAEIGQLFGERQKQLQEKSVPPS